jgi:hypothetical protein
LVGGFEMILEREEGGGGGGGAAGGKGLPLFFLIYNIKKDCI